MDLKECRSPSRPGGDFVEQCVRLSCHENVPQNLAPVCAKENQVRRNLVGKLQDALRWFSEDRATLTADTVHLTHQGGDFVNKCCRLPLLGRHETRCLIVINHMNENQLGGNQFGQEYGAPDSPIRPG